jgi:2-keto-4-pentenoate hydratase
LSHGSASGTIDAMITTPLTPEQLDRAAIALTTAGEQRQAIAPLTEARPELSIDDAYAIARRLVAARLSAGARVVGHKIGLTSVAAQQQLGVSEPDYGALLDVMEIDNGATIDATQFIAPRVELELAFHLGDRLAGPGISAADIRLADTVADNASSAGFVLGGQRCPLDELDVTAVEVELWRGDEVIERGISSAVLGDPCASVAWLANALGPRGVTLEPGHVILSGACTRMAAAAPGDVFRGDFGALGELRLAVAESQ